MTEEIANTALVAPPQPRQMLADRTIAVQSVQDLFQDPVMASRQGTNDKADKKYYAVQASRKQTLTSSSCNSKDEPAPKASKLSDQQRQPLAKMNVILRAKLGEATIRKTSVVTYHFICVAKSITFSTTSNLGTTNPFDKPNKLTTLQGKLVYAHLLQPTRTTDNRVSTLKT
jgi:hypothetical protein